MDLASARYTGLCGCCSHRSDCHTVRVHLAPHDKGKRLVRPALRACVWCVLRSRTGPRDQTPRAFSSIQVVLRTQTDHSEKQWRQTCLFTPTFHVPNMWQSTFARYSPSGNKWRVALAIVSSRVMLTQRPNRPLNRTRNGTPPSGIISFLPYGVVPLRAG